MKQFLIAAIAVFTTINSFGYYMTEVGRWTSRDPVEESDASNLYLFVYNRPVSAFDRLGLATIAAGSKPVEAVRGLASHLSLEYFDNDYTAGSTITATPNHSLELQSTWNYKIRVDATLIPVSQNIFGRWQRAPAGDWKSMPAFNLPIPISYVRFESEPQEIRSIYCGEDAEAVWQRISQAARAYAYAEQSTTGALTRWPNSSYGIPVPGFWTWNNSNTFVREMTQIIPGAPSPDVFPGRLHPGNMRARPVTGIPFSVTPAENPGPANTWRLQIEASNDYIQQQFDDSFMWGWLFRHPSSVPGHLNVIPLN